MITSFVMKFEKSTILFSPILPPPKCLPIIPFHVLLSLFTNTDNALVIACLSVTVAGLSFAVRLGRDRNGQNQYQGVISEHGVTGSSSPVGELSSSYPKVMMVMCSPKIKMKAQCSSS